MPKPPLVSVVEDDQHFREFMGRLMRSLGYTRRGFPVGSRFPRIPSSGRNGLLDH